LLLLRCVQAPRVVPYPTGKDAKGNMDFIGVDNHVKTAK